MVTSDTTVTCVLYMCIAMQGKRKREERKEKDVDQRKEH